MMEGGDKMEYIGTKALAEIWVALQLKYQNGAERERSPVLNKIERDAHGGFLLMR